MNHHSALLACLLLVASLPSARAGEASDSSTVAMTTESGVASLEGWSVGVDALALLDPLAGDEPGPSARSLIVRGTRIQGAWRISVAVEGIDRDYAAGTHAKGDTAGLVRMVGAGAWVSADALPWRGADGTGPSLGAYAHLRGFRYRWSDLDLDRSSRRDVATLAAGGEASWVLLFLERIEVEPYVRAGAERCWIRHRVASADLPWDDEYKDPWALDLRAGLFVGIRF